METKIKICGLTRAEDIDAVNAWKPDYVGFVLAPSRRQVTLEQTIALIKRLGPKLVPIGVFVNEPPERIIDVANRCRMEGVQLHGQESKDQVAWLKDRLPKQVSVIKAISMDQPGAWESWRDSQADYLLLDAGSGGGGTAFDHGFLQGIETLNKPWFLAGGIKPENGRLFAKQFSPYGIDVSSGVETEGVKDPEKIETIIRRIRNE